ncbi:FadR/GntR family transcriptional regulator [Frigidibacter sp. ROC022]|uniref:FadR/GntR family transcriptional regulator n=1 Tax=Frigidibacter sp. ROC022 TaxID=2971796 RepID=UPI00215B488C|nr:FadR/GntR family transcriptional regulator [Frigidibacter sp. ROC022]MCR8725198.1 FadR family transcriptional regulator [Frigidibacter sp. ROC022]
MVKPGGNTSDRLHIGVAAAVEERILSGALAVGSRLPSESEIAREFGISTRSAREAMQVLETKGLVRRRHGERAEVVRDDFGAFVDSLARTVRSRFAAEPSYLVQLMDVRRMFEVEAAGNLAGSDAETLAGLDQAVGQMAEAVTAKSFPDYAEADAAFHLALVRAVGNEILTTFYENLYGLITEIIRLTVRVPSKPMLDGLAEHRQMLACLRQGGAAAARKIVAEHVDQSKSYLQLALGDLARRKTEA